MVKQKMSSSPLLDHLIELRARLLRSVLALLVVFAALAAFANPIYRLIAEPLISQLPMGSSMIATDVAAPFLTPFKLVFVLALVIAIPFILWQLWSFVAPGLYQREKRLVAPLMLSSTLLFYAGIAFAYFVVLPLALSFLTKAAPADVQIATDISRYLDFVLTLFVAFGIAFEVPVLVILLCVTGATSVAAMRHKRPYIIVAAFIVGMVLTPPDVISQVLLAVPMWLLFEFGLLLASSYQSKSEQEVNNEKT